VIFKARPEVACPQCEPGKQDTRETAQETTQESAQETEPSSAGAEDLTGAEETILPARQVLSPRNVWLMTSMMRDVIQRGTGVRARSLGRSDLAGKTGTTNDQMDGWFSGFNHALVATAWVGFDRLEPLGRNETGGHSALPMWIDYMAYALKGVEERKQEPPEGLVTVRIDPATGLLASSGQRDAIFETFMVETVPTKTSDSVASGATGAGESVTDQLF
jgi:penicillin-binding protein 1A